MLEATHRRIAREIAKTLGLSDREANLLETGSVGPDSWADFPHHKGKEREIAKSILEARRLYIQDDDECFACLGNALHYIADKWTLRPRLGDKHTRYEHQINSLPILDDKQLEEAIKRPAIDTAKCFLFSDSIPLANPKAKPKKLKNPVITTSILSG